MKIKILFPKYVSLPVICLASLPAFLPACLLYSLRLKHAELSACWETQADSIAWWPFSLLLWHANLTAYFLSMLTISPLLQPDLLSVLLQHADLLPNSCRKLILIFDWHAKLSVYLFNRLVFSMLTFQHTTACWSSLSLYDLNLVWIWLGSWHAMNKRC